MTVQAASSMAPLLTVDGYTLIEVVWSTWV